MSQCGGIGSVTRTAYSYVADISRRSPTHSIMNVFLLSIRGVEDVSYVTQRTFFPNILSGNNMSAKCLHITKLFCKFQYYANYDRNNKQCDEHPQGYSGVPEKSTTFLLDLYLLIDGIRPVVIYRIMNIDVLISPSVYRIMDVARIAFHVLRVPSVDIYAVVYIFRPD